MSDDDDYDKGMPLLTSEVENGDDENGDPPKKKHKMILEQERFLPIANISRIMKRNLPSNGKLSKEAKECIQESVSEFISFLASEASDNCAEEKRKTITAEDLLNALRNLGFDNYHDPLKEYLRKYREANKLDKNTNNPPILSPMGSLSHEVQPIRPLEPSVQHLAASPHVPAALAPQNCPPSTSQLKMEPPPSVVSTHAHFPPDDQSNGNQRIAQKPPGPETSVSSSSHVVDSRVPNPVGFQSLPIIVDQTTGQQYITIQQANGQQALWPVQISSSINGAPVFTVSQPPQGQRTSTLRTLAAEVTSTSNSQMQPPQTVQSHSSTAEMVPTYSVTSSSNDLPQVHFINDHENPAPELCNSTSSTSNGSYYSSSELMETGYRRICFDAEDRPPPSYWRNSTASSSSSTPPPRQVSSPPAATSSQNNVVVTASSDGNKSKTKIDPQEWIKAPEFVPRHRKTLAHSFGVPNELLLHDVIDPSHSFHADVPPPFPPPPNSNFFPEMSFSNEFRMQHSVHQFQPQPLMKPRAPISANMSRAPLPGGRQGVDMPTPPPQMPLNRAGVPNLSFVPNGYTANVTSLNTGCGMAIPAIVLKKKRKRRHKKKDPNELMSKSEANASRTATREVTSTSDDLSTRESSQHFGANSSSFPEHLNTLSEEPEDRSESRHLIGGSCPDLSEAQLQIWDNILFKAIVSDADKHKTAVAEQKPCQMVPPPPSIMQTSICEVCPPAIFDALNEVVHADGIRSKEVRMLDKMLSGCPMEESFNESTMVERLHPSRFQKNNIGTSDGTTVKSLQKEIEDLEFKPVYSEYGYPQINNEKVQMTTFHHDSNTTDTVIVPRKHKEVGFVEDCFEGMQIRVNAFDNCDDLALSDSECPEPSRFQQMQWALQRNSKHYAAEWLPPERNVLEQQVQNTMSMLQEILDKMYIDPELLEALGEEQKQMLFIKMREEQIKRWRANEERLERLEQAGNAPKLTENGKKRVRWLKGTDGQDWVWVMGEHPSDRSIEEIIEEEEHAKAREIAESEVLSEAVSADDLNSAFYVRDVTPQDSPHDAQSLEERLKNQLSQMNVSSSNEGVYENANASARRSEQVESYNPKGSASYRLFNRTDVPSSSTIAQSSTNGVSVKARAGPPLPAKPTNLMSTRNGNNNNYLNASVTKNVDKPVADAHPVQMRANGDRKTPNVVKDEINKRQSEIFELLQEKRERLQREAEKDIEQQRLAWEDQERKAREAEAQIREIAQKAREQHREQSLRTSTSILPALRNSKATSVREAIRSLPRPPKPESRQAIVDWFKKDEVPRGTGMDPRTRLPAPWFHGIISRNAAEELLVDKPTGSFLVRVSERIWGYTISYVVGDGTTKHFLIERIPEGYQFLGTNQVVHSRLFDLVTYHETAPITASGKEILKWSVGQVSSIPDYMDLLDCSYIDSSRYSSRRF